MRNKNIEELVEKLSEEDDVYYIFCAMEPSHKGDGGNVTISGNGPVTHLKVLLTTIVNYMPELRTVFTPAFVEFSKHAPESLGGDGDIEAAISLAEAL